MTKLISMIALFLVVSCSTTGTFKIPAGSQLFIQGKPIPQTIVTNAKADETQLTEYKRTPFFWDVASGIPYRIEKDGKILDMGKIKSQFRVVSIFWTPAAIAYWPLGFNKKEVYDFTSKMDEKVRPDVPFFDAKHRK